MSYMMDHQQGDGARQKWRLTMTNQTKSEPFIHKFGGILEALAIRWTNPDGSPGGIVATSARVFPGAYIPYGDEVLPGTSVGQYGSVGYICQVSNRVVS